MTQNKKLMLTVLLLFAVITAAYWGYGALGKDYSDINLQPVPSASSSPQDSRPNQDEETPERTQAPDFEMTDLSGNPLMLSDLKGKPVVLNFWTSWCGFCIKEMPDFDDAYKEYGEEVSFVMLHVPDGVRETREKGERHYAEKGYSFPVYFDDRGMQGAEAYGITGFPSTFFIDRNGNLAAWAGGMIDKEALIKGIKLAQQQDAEKAIEQKNVSWCTMEPVYTKITAENARQMMDEFNETEDSTYVLLDVRTEQEYKERRIPGSILIPDYEIEQRAQSQLEDKRQVIFIYCRSGRRSEEAARKLVDMGYNHVYDMGGIIEWPYETSSAT